jgi:uncharacterized membrane protein
VPFLIEQEVQASTSMGLDAGVAAALSYLFTWVTGEKPRKHRARESNSMKKSTPPHKSTKKGLIIFLVEHSNQYVRYNAMQSMLLGATLSIFWVIAIILDALVIVTAGIFFNVLTFIVWVLSLVLVVLCMYFGYQGAKTQKRFSLPLLGNLAYNWTYGQSGSGATKAPEPTA